MTFSKPCAVRSGKTARSKLKQLRGVLRQGQLESEYYLHDREISDLLYHSFEAVYHDKEKRYHEYLRVLVEGAEMQKDIFRKVDNEDICLLFDPIEMADHCTFWEEG